MKHLKNTFKRGDLVEYNRKPFIVIGESMNGIHIIIIDASCSLKISVAASKLKHAYIQPEHELTKVAEQLYAIKEILEDQNETI